MRISFLAVELSRWDQAPAGDLLVVGFYADQRPLRGPAGLLDWRFDGRLSTLIAGGHLSGALEEQLLLPTNHRLPWRLALAVGLGPSGAFDEERAARAVRRTLATMRGLGLARVAIALPGREGGRIPARRALQIFLQEVEAAGAPVVEELTLVEPPAGQKELADVVRKRSATARVREPRARGTA